MKSIIALAVFSLCTASLSFAAEDKKNASESKPGKCCAAATKEGKTCTHECCAAAAKADKNCEKCGGSGHVERTK